MILSLSSSVGCRLEFHVLLLRLSHLIIQLNFIILVEWYDAVLVYWHLWFVFCELLWQLIRLNLAPCRLLLRNVSIHGYHLHLLLSHGSLLIFRIGCITLILGLAHCRWLRRLGRDDACCVAHIASRLLGLVLRHDVNFWNKGFVVLGIVLVHRTLLHEFLWFMPWVLSLLRSLAPLLSHWVRALLLLVICHDRIVLASSLYHTRVLLLHLGCRSTNLLVLQGKGVGCLYLLLGRSMLQLLLDLTTAIAEHLPVRLDTVLGLHRHDLWLLEIIQVSIPREVNRLLMQLPLFHLQIGDRLLTVRRKSWWLWHLGLMWLDDTTVVALLVVLHHVENLLLIAALTLGVAVRDQTRMI